MPMKKRPNYSSYYWRRKRCMYVAEHGEAAWLRFMRLIRFRRYIRSPKGCYARHKDNAKRRGIAWEFTFATWWAKWERSEKWDKRGNKKGQYVMARISDSGPYATDNTHIVRSEANAYASVYGRSFPPSASPEYSAELAAIL